MSLLLGLGNPGPQYARTRHNIGWLVLDMLADRWKARSVENTGAYELLEAQLDGRDVYLMKPLTFMNLSGTALDAWRSHHSFESEFMLVVTDDVYLPLGHVRMRGQGSSGGHRGLDSIAEALGSSDFARLRVGVGAVDSSAELREHVLETFEAEDEPIVTEAITEAANAAECWVREGLTAAMNRFNRRVRKEVSEP